MLHNKLLTKENIDEIFTCFALNCLKDNNHPSKIEIYMVGGGAIMLNFDYRLSTIDFDAFFIKDEVVNAAIKETAKEKHLPSDWLNQDFVNTPSFSSKIVQVSKLYKVYHNIVYLYSLEPVYLIAMKLKSSRPTGGRYALRPRRDCFHHCRRRQQPHRIDQYHRHSGGRRPRPARRIHSDWRPSGPSGFL